MPTARTITVNMASLKAPLRAKWFDPSNGAYTAIFGGLFANTGTRQFTPPGKNQDGDSDWVLLLAASDSVISVVIDAAFATKNWAMFTKLAGILTLP